MPKKNQPWHLLAFVAPLTQGGAPGAQAAEPLPITLEVPVGCALGRDCFVQQYFDHDSGPGRRDHRCGTLLGDGHDGIDFRVRQDGREVAVLAAADGTVLRTRDEMPDQSVRQAGAVPANRMAGNGVVIDHGALTTQYSHMKRGSIAVRPGQKVSAGQRIGTVGMSGNTEYPHLHFSVHVDGAKIDPFTGTGGPVSCGDGVPDGLWSVTAAARLRYVPSAVVDGGFSPGRLSDAEARAGTVVPVGAAPPALVLWADSFGTRTGDEERFTIRSPSGKLLLDRRQPLTRTSLTWFSFAGVPRPTGGWETGRHEGEYTLRRDGRVIGTIRAQATLGGSR